MRLSDFQIPDAPMPVDAKLMARHAKAVSTQVDWKRSKVIVGEGALQSHPMRSLLMDAARDERRELRARMHDSLDHILDEEPTESDSNEEPEEEEAQAMDAFESFVRMFYTDPVFKAIGTRQRSETVDRGSATVIPTPHKIKIDHRAGYICDSEYISTFLHPDMLCEEAEIQLQDVSLDHQKNNANRGFWSGLYYFLREQPKGSRIRDIKNRVCLSTLLANTLGGRPNVFGA